MSFLCHDVSRQEALLSDGDGSETVIVGPKGMWVIRDVSTIHCGSENNTAEVGVHPTVRIITKLALQQGYSPDPSIL